MIMTSPLRFFWHSPTVMDRVSAVLVTAALLTLLASAGWWLMNRPVFAVKRVLVDTIDAPLVHISERQIQIALSEAITGTVLLTDLAAIQRVVQAMPWVRKATVRRVWPNRLLIRIEEHRAVAQWEGSRLLVNHYGEAFNAPVAEHAEHCRLIRLAGPSNTQSLVLERARQIHGWLAPLNQPLEKLTLSAQYAWTAQLAGGLTLELGRDALPTPLEERIRMFVKTQSWLDRELVASDGWASLGRVDLRYAIGYAFRPSDETPVRTAVGVSNQPLCIGQIT
jgi:cell division protein FtsQ